MGKAYPACGVDVEENSPEDPENSFAKCEIFWTLVNVGRSLAQSPNLPVPVKGAITFLALKT